MFCNYFQTCKTFFLLQNTNKRYLKEFPSVFFFSFCPCNESCFEPHWFILYRQKQFFKIYFMFDKRKNVIQVWNDMRVKKLLHNFHFLLFTEDVCEWARPPPTLPTSTWSMRHESALKTDVTYLMPVCPTCVQHTAAAGTTGRLTCVSVNQVTPTLLKGTQKLLYSGVQKFETFKLKWNVIYH